MIFSHEVIVWHKLRGHVTNAAQAFPWHRLGWGAAFHTSYRKGSAFLLGQWTQDGVIWKCFVETHQGGCGTPWEDKVRRSREVDLVSHRSRWMKTEVGRTGSTKDVEPVELEQFQR